MKNFFLNIVKNLFNRLGISLIRKSALEILLERSIALDKIYLASRELDVIKKLNIEFSQEIFSIIVNSESKSQLRQDLLVLSHHSFKRDGYFVEFGATDGVKLSNTYLLEQRYNWKGILAEPAKLWHKELLRNRSCFIELNCVWSESGTSLEFEEMGEAELSKVIGENSQFDHHQQFRKPNKKYTVSTISLFDMLVKYKAPAFIDYLSIDTEGSEFIILSEFPFERYTFGFISVEHNYTVNREKIFNLLSSKGYIRIHEDLSLFDDWYVYSL